MAKSTLGAYIKGAAGTGVPSGGTTGQILAKSSNADNATEWVDQPSGDATDAASVDAAGAVMNTDTSTAAMQFVVDEDNMASDSATKVPTQQSVKQYVDDQIASVGGTGTSVFSNEGTWNTATGYTVGDYVRYNGVGYECYSSHTSSGTDEPGIGANWADYWKIYFEAPLLMRSMTIPAPTVESIPIDLSPFANVTIQEVSAHVVGSSTPSVDFNINHGGNDLWSADKTANQTSPTTQSTTYNDATVASTEAITLDISAVSGTVNYLVLTVRYTED